MIRFVLCLLLFLPCAGFTAPLTAELITQSLQKDASLIQSVEIKDTSTPVNLDLKLKPGVVKIGEADFDGFRFKAPAGSDALDWIWYFNIPANWGNWYIVPVQGEMSEAFIHWINADKLYKDLDQPGEENRLRALQTLPGGYFKPGQEYIVWFRMVGEGSGDSLRARISFSKKEPERGFDSFEKALDLKPLESSAQVEQLKSRGGKILLDTDFFENSYAEGRIESVFSNLRQTKNLAGGYFITTEVAVPPIRNQPSLTDIRKKYGEADFVLTSEENKKAWMNQGYKEGKTGEDGLITYYYDYFGFEVAANDAHEKVRQVTTAASNYALLIPKEDGDSFGRAVMKNLTVFYRDKKEVGRFYNFLEGEKPPLCIKEPPAGKYLNEDETLEYLGNGKWVATAIYPNGSVARKIPLENNLAEGKVEGFYPSGQIKFFATYRQGRLESEVVQYSETGELIKSPTSVEPKPRPVSP